MSVVSELLMPYNARTMRCWPASDRTNRVTNDDAECSAPCQNLWLNHLLRPKREASILPHGPYFPMTMKRPALLALVGTVLITVFLFWTFIPNVVNVRGVDAPVVLFSSFIYAFGCLTLAIFFFGFHRTQS